MKYCKPSYSPTSLLFCVLFLIGILAGCKDSLDFNEQATDRGDSIALLLHKIKTTPLDDEQKHMLLKKAYNLTSGLTMDSVALKQLNAISYQAFMIQDSVLFFDSGNKAHNLALLLKDTLELADMHWNYGAFYLKQLEYDSSYVHYQKAHKLFRESNNPFFAGKMLYNMAFILSRLRDYTGAEVYLFQAIEIFKPLEKHKQLYHCYNLLGVIYEELEDYDRSLNYHQKALEYLDFLKDSTLFLQDSYNNIGLIYQKQGKQAQAISYFDKALKLSDIRTIDPFLYARLIDNKANSQFLNNDMSNLPKAFFEALSIRDSMHSPSGIIMSRAHLASYYAKKGDTSMALDHAKKAYLQARDIKNNRDILLALDLLSKLDLNSKPKYLEQYILIDRQVQASERNTRNKFMRIQYETDQYIALNKQLANRATWTLIGGFVCLLLLFLTYLVYRQKSQNKLLLLESHQQQANEQIYRLTLRQQEQLQQGRNQERIRISEDLHDSIISDLFALRLGWAYLNLKGHSNDLQQHQTFLEELQRLEKKIRELSHELKNKMIEHPIDFIFLVERLVKKRSSLGGFQYQFSHDGNIPWEQIDNLIKVHLYHIIEEALQNCIKHAQASCFSLVFLWSGQLLTLVMTDDGIGTAKMRSTGIGLKNMQSRAKKTGGTYSIKSEVKHGTIITIHIPINPR